jgi:hypothetical protein
MILRLQEGSAKRKPHRDLALSFITPNLSLAFVGNRELISGKTIEISLIFVLDKRNKTM